MYSHFVALRIRPADGEIGRSNDGPEPPARYLLGEWPATEAQPVRFWMSDLPADTPPTTLVRTARVRRRIEHDCREKKPALWLARFKCRTGWGRRHHVTHPGVPHLSLHHARTDTNLTSALLEIFNGVGYVGS